MGKAFIKRVSPDQWRLLVSDKEGSCEELLSGVTNAQPGSTTFVTTLRRHIKPDGTDEIGITDFWTAGHPTTAKLSTAKISGPTDKGAKVLIELTRTTDEAMTAEGTLEALGCGDQPADDAGVPKDSHVSAATIEIAGTKLDIKSATVSGDDLVLSSGPKDCSTVTPWSQVLLRRTAGTWSLSGTWFVDESKGPAPSLKATLGAQGSGKDGPTIAVTVTGSDKIGAYPIKLDGTIEAIDCQPAKR